jgi:hypothetical protein
MLPSAAHGQAGFSSVHFFDFVAEAMAGVLLQVSPYSRISGGATKSKANKIHGPAQQSSYSRTLFTVWLFLFQATKASSATIAKHASR